MSGAVIPRGTLLTNGRPGPGGLSVVTEDCWAEDCLDGSSNTQEITALYVRPAFVWKWRKWRCAGHLLEEVLWPEPPHFRLHFRCLVCGKVFRSKRRRALQRIRREMELAEERRIAAQIRSDMESVVGTVDPDLVREQLKKTLDALSKSGVPGIGPVEVRQDPHEPTLYHARISLLSVRLSGPTGSNAGLISFPAGPSASSGPIVLPKEST